MKEQAKLDTVKDALYSYPKTKGQPQFEAIDDLLLSYDSNSSSWDSDSDDYDGDFSISCESSCNGSIDDSSEYDSDSSSSGESCHTSIIDFENDSVSSITYTPIQEELTSSMSIQKKDTSYHSETSSVWRSSLRIINFLADGMSSDDTKEFKRINKRNNGKASRDEIAEWVKVNPSMWGMLSVNLNLGESQCIQIASRVVMEVAGNHQEGQRQQTLKSSTRYVTRTQFLEFKKRFVHNPKGSQEFFHRTVFAVYDEGGKGIIDKQEFDRLVDIFYESGSIFAGDARLPPKEKLVQKAYDMLDTNGDGLFSFEEIRPLLCGSAFKSIAASCDNHCTIPKMEASNNKRTKVKSYHVSHSTAFQDNLDEETLHSKRWLSTSTNPRQHYAERKEQTHFDAFDSAKGTSHSNLETPRQSLFETTDDLLLSYDNNSLLDDDSDDYDSDDYESDFSSSDESAQSCIDSSDESTPSMMSNGIKEILTGLAPLSTKDSSSSLETNSVWSSSLRIVSFLADGMSSEDAKEFKRINTSNTGKASSDEITGWVKMNPSMWGMLSVNLNLSESTCIEIATRVIMEVADNYQEGRKQSNSRQCVTRTQFLEFKKRFVHNPKGSQEFFQRSVFAVYDKDRNGWIDNKEFEHLVDIFYETGSIFAGDARLPTRAKLIEKAYEMLDKNRDGLFTFEEIRPLLSGSAFKSIAVSRENNYDGTIPNVEAASNKRSDESNRNGSQDSTLIDKLDEEKLHSKKRLAAITNCRHCEYPVSPQHVEQKDDDTNCVGPLSFEEIRALISGSSLFSDTVSCDDGYHKAMSNMEAANSNHRIENDQNDSQNAALQVNLDEERMHSTERLTTLTIPRHYEYAKSPMEVNEKPQEQEGDILNTEFLTTLQCRNEFVMLEGSYELPSDCKILTVDPLGKSNINQSKDFMQTKLDGNFEETKQEPGKKESKSQEFDSKFIDKQNTRAGLHIIYEGLDGIHQSYLSLLNSMGPNTSSSGAPSPQLQSHVEKTGTGISFVKTQEERIFHHRGYNFTEAVPLDNESSRQSHDIRASIVLPYLSRETSSSCKIHNFNLLLLHNYSRFRKVDAAETLIKYLIDKKRKGKSRKKRVSRMQETRCAEGAVMDLNDDKLICARRTTKKIATRYFSDVDECQKMNCFFGSMYAISKKGSWNSFISKRDKGPRFYRTQNSAQQQLRLIDSMEAQATGIPKYLYKGRKDVVKDIKTKKFRLLRPAAVREKKLFNLCPQPTA